MAIHVCVRGHPRIVPNHTQVLAGACRWIWVEPIDHWRVQSRCAHMRVYREVCVRVESREEVCVTSELTWVVSRREDQEAGTHADLFSLTKLAATTVVSWRGAQDRQATARGHGRWQVGGKGSMGRGYLLRCLRAWHPRHSPHTRFTHACPRDSVPPSKPSSAWPPPPAVSWGEGPRLGNRP